jgi:hypothetical protein
MLYLNRRVVKVVAPKEVENNKPWILTHRRQLILGDVKSKIDMDGHKKGIVDQKLD